MNSRTWDLNPLLRVLNAGLAAAIVIAYLTLPGEPHMDRWTLWIAIGFAILLHALLKREARERNPLLLFLVFHTEIFFLFRIFTLILFPNSAVLYRGNIGPHPFNLGLVELIALISAMATGLLVPVVSPNRWNVEETPDSERSPSAALLVVAGLFLSTILVKGILLRFFPPTGLFVRISSYFDTFFNPSYSYVLGLMYFTIHGRKLRRSVQIGFSLLFLALSAYFISAGQRSVPMVVAFSMVFALLAIRGRLLLSRRVVVSAVVAILPCLVAFDFATHLRTDQTDVITTLRNYRIPGKAELTPRLTLITERLGALDMGIEMILYHDMYSRIVRPGLYARAILDNSAPWNRSDFKLARASNMMRRVYFNHPVPLRIDIENNYQSDMFTGYAEASVFFGFPLAMIALFLIGSGFRQGYAAFDRQRNVFAKAVVLFIFYYFGLISYGFDWTVIELSRMAAFGFIFWCAVALTERLLISLRKI